MKNEERRAQEIFAELVNEFTDKKIVGFHSGNVRPKLKFEKSTREFGSCQRIYVGNDRYEFKVSINTYALQNEECVRNTLAHELVHTCDGCFNHGKQFKRVGYWVKRKMGIDVNTYGTAEEALKSGLRDHQINSAKYIVGCPTCNQRWYKQRMCKVVEYPQFFSCAKCRTPLVRVK